MKKSLLAIAAVAASALLLSGCAGAPASGDSDRVQVVATTDVYGSIAEAVGGPYIDVTSMVASASADPHDFQPSAKDQLLVQRAGLLIENGGGYDPFLEGLVKASGSKAPLITAAELSPAYPADGDLDGFNEHVFYDVAVMATVADRIASELGTLEPAHAAEFTANAQTFGDGIATIQADLAAIKSAHEGVGVFVTEPLPLYLTDAAGLVNKTPGAFSEAVEEGQDVPPATLLTALALISSGQARVVITNAQAAGAETASVEDAAKKAGTPVLKFSELVPDGKTYLTWMQSNVAELKRALE